MGLVDKWAERRRRKELEEVNKRLEELKAQNIGEGEKKLGKAERIEDGASKRVERAERAAGMGMQEKSVGYVKSDINMILLVVIGICIVALIGVTMFYQSNVKDLQKRYDERVQELEALSGELSNKTTMIAGIQTKLKQREQVEQNLSSRYDQLLREKEELDDEVEVLTAKESNLTDEITKIREMLKREENETRAVVRCIEETFDEDFDDCNLTITI